MHHIKSLSTNPVHLVHTIRYVEFKFECEFELSGIQTSLTGISEL